MLENPDNSVLMKPFKSTELREGLPPAFTNGDAPALTKTLTNPDVSERSLDAVFRERPAYFRSSVESSENRHDRR